MLDEMFYLPLNIENNSFSETDDTKKINSETIITDFIGQPFNFQLNQEFENNILDDKLSITNKKTQKKPNNIFSIYIRKKRGRKKEENDSLTKIHGKFDDDNIIRKIQVSYTNFVTDLVNIILAKINRKDLHFIPLNYFYKRRVNKDFRDSLKNQTIGEVLVNKISSKYSTKNKFINREIYEKIKKENVNILINILNQNIFFFFDKIYYINCRQFNLNKFGFNDLDIQLSNKIELFEDLIEKNKNEIHFEKYKVKLNECAKKYFLQSRKDIFKCNY
jgi:hypothetical protein